MFKYNNKFKKRLYNKVLTHKNNTQFSESNEKKRKFYFRIENSLENFIFCHFFECIC